MILNGGSQNHGFQYWNGLILDLGNPNLGNLQLTSGWSGKFSAANRDGFVLSVSVALVFQGKLTRNYVLILFKWKPCFWSLVQNQCQVFQSWQACKLRKLQVKSARTSWFLLLFTHYNLTRTNQLGSASRDPPGLGSALSRRKKLSRVFLEGQPPSSSVYS